MLVDDFFKHHGLPLENKTLVVATSGGPDSMALLDMLVGLQPQYHLAIIAAHLDHQLRADSAHESEIIAAYCREKPIKVVNQFWPTALHPQKGVEAAAREYRYHFLVQVMQENHADYLLTAHHCDDLLENILLKFIRSGNPSEMNSLQAVTKMKDRTLLRPFLSVEKEMLLKYDQEKHIPYVIDETNNEDDVLRNRLRHHFVPLLKQENPQIGQNALRFSNQLNLVDSLVKLEFTQLGLPEDFLGIAFRIKISRLQALSKKQQLLYWQYFIWQKFHIRVNEHLGEFNLITYQAYFYLYQNNLPPQETLHNVSVGQKFVFNKRHCLITIRPCASGKLVGRFYALAGAKLRVGSLTPGTRLQLTTGRHVKSKKKFAAQGIPNVLRPYCLAVLADETPVFVEKTYVNQNNRTELQQYYLYDNI